MAVPADDGLIVRTPRSSRWLLPAIIALAAFVRFWGLTFGLPNTDARPDEWTLVTISSGLLFVSVNPRFFHWPSLELYVVAFLYRLAWQVQHWRGLFQHKYEIAIAAVMHPAAFLLVPRVIGAATGVLTVWFVYRLTRTLIDRRTGLVAAFFLAIAFLHVRDSHFGVTDVPMTCLAVAAMLPLARAFTNPGRTRDWRWAGILTGLAASTKYGGGLLVVVALSIAVIAIVDARGDQAARRATLLGLGVFLVAALLAFIAGTPFAVIDMPHFIEGLRFDQSHLMLGHGITLGRGWLYHALFTLRYGLGMPLAIAAVAGIVLLARQSVRTAIVIGVFPVVYYAVTGRGYTVFVRYLIPIVPFLCITAAVAVVQIGQIFAGRRPSRAAAWISVIALCVAAPSIRTVVAFDRIIRQTDTRVLAVQWLDARRQPDDWIVDASFLELYREYPGFGPEAPFRLARFDPSGPAFLSKAGAPVTPEWVVLARSPLVVYTSPPEELLGALKRGYVLAETFVPTSASEPAEIFDQQDKFFLPYADFTARIRPGPEIQIYRRRGI